MYSDTTRVWAMRVYLSLKCDVFFLAPENDGQCALTTGGGKLLIVSVLQFLGIEREEILVEDNAQFVKQLGVDGVASEDIIYIAPVAMYLATEPCHRPLLAAQFLLDNLTYQYRLCIRYFVSQPFHFVWIFQSPCCRADTLRA